MLILTDVNISTNYCCHNYFELFISFIQFLSWNSVHSIPSIHSVWFRSVNDDTYWILFLNIVRWWSPIRCCKCLLIRWCLTIQSWWLITLLQSTIWNTFTERVQYPPKEFFSSAPLFLLWVTSKISPECLVDANKCNIMNIIIAFIIIIFSSLPFFFQDGIV